jgi:hypothetical protein
MSRTKITLMAFVLSVLAIPRALIAGDSPFDVGSRAQLFVDKLVIRESEGVSFELQQAKKHPANPLVKVDRPWEGWRLEIYGSVIYDEEENLFKMWYLAESPEDFPHYATLYATSTDGVNWEKPLVGTIESRRGGKHNAVADGYLLASVIKDRSDPNPNRRYKMICWRQTPPHGPQTMISPNGLNWTQVGEKPICRSSDVITGYFDRSRQQYVAFPKLSTKVRGHVRRCFGLTTSSDFQIWTESRLVLTPDARDDAGSLGRIERVRHKLDRRDDPELMRTEFYGMGVYQQESCTIGFPWVLTINNNARYGNHEGPAELQLAVSRDLIQWDRPFRTAAVPIYEQGRWDESYQQSAAEAIRVGDEVWLYYCGANYTHGTPCLYRAEGTGRLTEYTSSIGLAIWQLDRFVSARSAAEGGILTTVPIRYSGDRLEINARTRENGSIIVELCDATGKRMDGVPLSEPFSGDEIRTSVQFGRTNPLTDLAGQPVCLRFHLKNAELFSFAFRDSSVTSASQGNP